MLDGVESWHTFALTETSEVALLFVFGSAVVLETLAVLEMTEPPVTL